MDTTDEEVHKILVLGPPMAGKTTFIRLYIHRLFEVTYKQTFGVDFEMKHLEWRDGRRITLQFWDIAGQERTQSMTRIYYQDAHACVIMFDLTYERSLDVCLQWKRDLDDKCQLDNGDPIPCLLLGNKSDLMSQRKISTENGEKFAKENGFICYMETSVKNNVNVTEAMNFLVEHLLSKESNLPNTPHKDPFPPQEPAKPASTCC